MAKNKFILASGSPRRKDLLQQAGVQIDLIQAADIDESTRDNESPTDYVLRLAVEKAAHVALAHPKAVVLAADTTVVLGNPESHTARILGKPGSKSEAVAMLQALSSSSHYVLSGVAIDCRARNVAQSFVVQTSVHLRELSEAEINAYCDSDEPYDKAGGYAVQGRASSFVQSVEGSYTNVVGLPLAETVVALRPLLENAA